MFFKEILENLFIAYAIKLILEMSSGLEVLKIIT